MALETVSTIYDLVATNPTAGDQKLQGDDHIRNIKAAILASFAGSVANRTQNIGHFVVKFGTGTTAADGTATVTFPDAFPSSGIVGFGGLATNTVNAPIFVNCASPTATQMGVFACNTSGVGQAVTFRWFVIGN